MPPLPQTHFHTVSREKIMADSSRETREVRGENVLARGSTVVLQKLNNLIMATRDGPPCERNASMGRRMIAVEHRYVLSMVRDIFALSIS